MLFGGVYVRNVNTRLRRMRKAQTAFGKKNYFFPFYGFVFNKLTKQFFALIVPINISMVKRINAKIKAQANNSFHIFDTIFLTPAIKTINHRRNLWASVA